MTLDDVESSYTVSFNTNGGNESISSQIINDATPLVYPTIPTKDGFLFAGWYDNEECEGDLFDFSQGVVEDVELYAKWVTYSNKAIGIVCGENTINITGGNTTQYFAFVPLISGSITINVGKNAWIGCGTSTPSGTYSGSAYNTKTITVAAGNVYYISLQSYYCYSTAQYIGETYLNVVGSVPTAGGTIGIDNNEKYEVEYNSSFEFVVPEVSEGYVFKGWYDGVGGTGNQITGADGHSLANWTALSDMTLYAKIEAE